MPRPRRQDDVSFAGIDHTFAGIVPTLTGGDVFFHPRFNPVTDAPTLYAELRRVLTRTTGYNASLKIRCSPGLRIAPASHRGSFFQRTAAEVEFGIITADHAISAAIEHSSKLDEREFAFLQMAALYTSVQGERRVRVCNLALQVVDLPGNVFEYADMEAVVCHLVREGVRLFLALQSDLIDRCLAIHCRTSQPMDHIREDVTEKCSTILLGYRRTCGATAPDSQVRSFSSVQGGESHSYHNLALAPRGLPCAARVWACDSEV
jgi:protein transport protein SEC24